MMRINNILHLFKDIPCSKISKVEKLNLDSIPTNGTMKNFNELIENLKKEMMQSVSFPKGVLQTR